MEKALVLQRIYRDPEHPASYGGVNRLYRAAKEEIPDLTLDQTKDYLAGDEAYSLHKQARRRFPRNRIVVHEIDELWQLDLMDVSNLQDANGHVRYLCVAIDVLSKAAWAVPMHNKQPASVVVALKEIFRTSGRTPWKLQTDKGGEFNNALVRNFLKQEDIHYYTTQNEETKAAVAERFIRTLRGRLARHMTAQRTRRFLDVLPACLRAYNNAVHSRTKFAPSQVTKDNEAQVWQNLYQDLKPSRAPVAFKRGDVVRLSTRKDVFQKGYTPNWTEERFTVDRVVERKQQQQPVYGVKDLNEEAIVGTFYTPELQKVTPKPPDEVYRVERILKVRRRGGRHGPKEYLVRWLGYPSSFDSWTQDIVVGQ